METRDKFYFRRLISLVAFNWFVLNPLFNWVMFYAFLWRGSEDIRLILIYCILPIKIYHLIQRDSNHQEDPTGASNLYRSGGVWILLFPHPAPQPPPLLQSPQDPPRVDGSSGPGRSLRSPCGALPLQPAAHSAGPTTAGQPPHHSLDLVRPGSGGDRQCSLRLSPAPPALSGVPRLSSP